MRRSLVAGASGSDTASGSASFRGTAPSFTIPPIFSGMPAFAVAGSKRFGVGGGVAPIKRGIETHPSPELMPAMRTSGASTTSHTHSRAREGVSPRRRLALKGGSFQKVEFLKGISYNCLEFWIWGFLEVGKMKHWNRYTWSLGNLSVLIVDVWNSDTSIF